MAECAFCWHQRVARLPSLSLDDLVRDTLIIIPPIRRRRTVELPHERECGGSTFHLQQSLHHSASRDKIESTNAVHRQQGGIPVQISQGLGDVRHALTSRLGESELERRSCTFDGGGQLL